jgi:formylglycine-generating enzyme required for sulfatase activity
MPLVTGQVLNSRYRIVKLLGQGGFGAVYRAWDTTFDLPCAIKENFETGEAAQRQFLREARLLRTLRHPNLPEVSDYFVVPAQGQYLVMDFVEGEDLAQMQAAAGGPLPEAQVLAWAAQTCDALSYLHSQNPPVIHRDIKPANIKIRPDDQAMLVDFGIAKQFDPNAATTMGARAVTPGYSPLEQYGRGGRTDARSDIYALGATLYALLTGKEPEDAPERNLGSELVLPRVLNPRLSSEAEAIILKAMAILPGERYQSAAELGSVLREPGLVAVGQPLPPGSQAGGAGVSSSPGTGGDAGLTQVVYPPVRDSAPYSSPPGAIGRKAQPLPWVWIGMMAALLVVVIGLAVLFSRGSTGGGQPATAITGEGSLATEIAVGIATTAPKPSGTPLPPSDTPLPTFTLVPSDTPAPTLSPPPTALPQRIADDFGVEMALVPAGEFQMGSENGHSVERPVHTVYLDAFYMDIYEVTNALYEKCVQAGACTLPGDSKSYTRSSYYGNAQYDDYPVIWVDWEQAGVYCAWRGARLPSEAEWEKAARGGLDGKLYPWGDESPDCKKGAKNGAKLDDDGGCNETDTEPVGSYSPNGYGLYDMAGNVWEWAADWYGGNYYASSPSEDPAGPASGDDRVVRGGSWNNRSNGVRSAFRYNAAPDLKSGSVGFRCSRSP